MANPQVIVELKLALDKLREQMRRDVPGIIKGGMSGLSVAGPTGAVKGTQQLAKGLDQVTKSSKDARKAMIEAVAAGKALGAVAPGMQIRMFEERAQARPMTQERLDRLMMLRMQRAQGLRGYNREQFFGGRLPVGGLATAPSLLQQKVEAAAIPPVIPIEKLKRGLFTGANFGMNASEAQTTATLGAQFLPTGITSALRAGAAGFRMGGPVVAVATATFVAAVTGFKIALKEASKAARLYARALRSGGLPLGFSVRRGTLASIIGVSEQQVFQYGRAVKYLNERLGQAPDTIAKLTPQLTALSWDWKLLKTDVEALTMQIGNALAPAIRAMTQDVRDMVRSVGPLWSMLMGKVQQDMKAAALLLAAGTMNWKMVAEIISGKAFEAAPQPAAWSRRMPASAWERMGLVVGPGGMDAQSQTARNTKRSAELLHQIAGNTRKWMETGVPRTGSMPWYASP